MKTLSTILIAVASSLMILGCKSESTVTGLPDTGSTTTTAPGAPLAPTSFSTTGLSASGVTIHWADNATDEVIYEVEQCSGTGCTTFATAASSPRPAGTTSLAVTGLSSATIYRFRVRAVNSNGNSTWLTSGDITTSSVTVSDPTSLAATAQNTTSIALGWTDNATNETGYEIESCTGLACSTYAAVAGSPFAANSTSATISGLTASTYYSFRVRAVSSGSNSGWASVTDLKTAPAAPTGFTNGTIGATSINFSWTDNGSDESTYAVESCAGAGCTSFAAVSGSPFAANTVSHTETGLSESSTYRFRVKASSSAGSSAYLTSGDITTIIAAPTGFTLSGVTDTTASFSWTDNSSTELIYEIESCTGASCNTFAAVSNSPRPSGTTSLTVSSLTQATVYRFRVRATNSTGSSAWLTSGDITTDPTVVAAPSTLAVTGRTPTSISLSWSDNSSNETGFEIESCTGASCTSFAAVSGSPFAANATSTTISSLTASTTYRFRIRSITAATQSAWVTSNDIATSPAAPTVLSMGTITPTSIAFGWTDNATDELIYEIQKCTGAACSSFVSAASSPKPADTINYVESSLTENTTYRFRVRATNSNGSSDWLTSTDQTTLIAPPTGITTGTVTDTSVTIGWTDNSASETGYEVEKCSGSGCSSFAAIAGSPVAANSVGATITALTGSTTYRFRVRAAGSTPSTYLTTGDITTAPAAPTGFTLGAVAYNSVDFTWTDNASDETSYTVERCTGTGCNSGFTVLTSALAANSNSYTDTSVSGATIYRYRVKAVNSNGSSSYLTYGSDVSVPTAPVAAYACTSPTTVILDRGQKTGIAASQRGTWSDVKYIPSGTTTGTGNANGNVVTYSSKVGVAYVDTGSQSLKYTYWNGSVFKTEVVFGDTAANITWVRLGYLSNSTNAGLPIIAFTNGAVNNGQIMVAVRSTTSTSTTGTWTVQAVDTGGGAANRSLEMAISPIDQVALIYQASTTPNANNVRFIYCNSSCNDPNNYVSQGGGTTGRIDAGGALASQIKMGLAFCQMSAGVYNPVAFYGLTATTNQLAICNTAGSNNLSACLLNSGWTKTTATIASVGAGTTSDIYIDPQYYSGAGDTVKIAVKDSTGIKEYVSNVACSALAAGSTFSAAGSTTIIGAAAATAGNAFLKILKSADYATAANERYYIVYNEALTGLRWVNSQTSTFTGVWNQNGTASSLVTPAAITTPAAGSWSMGADLNLTTKQLIMSYGPGALTFNISLGVVNDFTSPGDSTSASNIYYQLPVENAGNIQLNAAHMQNMAVAATSTYKPAVAYVDYSTTVATTGRLKYAFRNGTTASSSWTINQVPAAAGTSAPQYPSMAFDSNDQPWIGYWDNAAARFVLATNTATDGSGTWTSYQFPVTTAGHGAAVAQPSANMVAVAMSCATPTTCQPVLIVLDTGTGGLAVKSAKLNPSTGAWSTVATVGTLSATGASFLTADYLTSTNMIVVAYQDLTAGSIRVKYSASTDGGATWPTNSSTPYNVSSLSQGEGAVIKINPSTSKPAIAYYDRTNNKLFFARCTANCTGSSAPTFTGSASSVLNGIGISGLSAAGTYNLLNAALSYSAAGDAYLLYNSGALDVGALRMIDNVGGTMPSGLPTTVIAGANGAFANASATNFGIPWQQMAYRMGNGVLAIGYLAPGNFLGFASCGD